MRLKLRVISDHYRQLGKSSSKLFDVHGGRIGRAPDNDWVLPDNERYISSHHCKVVFKAGRWLLEDTSTNGVFVNGSSSPINVEGPRVLVDGDRLRLGDYEVLVSLDERYDAAAPVPTKQEAPARTANRFQTEDLGEELDLMSLLGPKASARSEKDRPDANPSRTAPESRTRPSPRDTAAPKPSKPRPPAAKPAVTSLLDSTGGKGPTRTVVQNDRPPDWQLRTRPFRPADHRPRPEPPSRPKTAAQPGKSGGHAELDAGVEAFCRGAGIDPSALPFDAQAALLTLAGQMVRETVVGLMEGLRARSEFKDRMHLDNTTIQPADNNPLKFANDVDDAMRKLLDVHSSRYLAPVEALRDAFLDLRTHEQALATALKGALEEYLARFSPGELEQGFDRGLKRGGILGAANRMKYWDLYGDFYHLVTQQGADGLPPTFAEELRKAYDARAQELRYRRRR
jgi:type VI secretion system protein